MGWILRIAKASRKAKAVTMLMNAETPISSRVAIEEFRTTQRERERERNRDACVEEGSKGGW
jgi:DNA polymerase III delta prime subunit